MNIQNLQYINAGAGSGKTYTLKEKVYEAVMNGINPSELILTTYTVTAANEIKQRVRQKLLEQDKFELAAMVDGAAIGTIHSIAFSFVEKYWYRLGLSPKLKTLAEGDQKIYLSESLADMLTAEDYAWFNDYKEYFGFDDPNAYSSDQRDHWRRSLEEIVTKSDYYRMIPEGKSCKEALEPSRKRSVAYIEQMFSAPEVDVDGLKSFMETYLIFCSTQNTAKAKKQHDFIATIDWENVTYSCYCEIRKYLLDPVGGKKGKQLPGYEEAVSIARKYDLSQTFGKKVIECINRVFDLAARWQQNYRKFKKEHQLIDFNDMELYFCQLLDFDDVQEEIRDAYKMVMVDEFQDSNPIQLDIYSKLSVIIGKGKGDEFTSYWVGDPKQAIYGFRGSDTDLIQNVSDYIEENKGVEKKLGTHSLKTSYRSRETLVNLVNNVFLRSFEGIIKPHEEDDMITLKVNEENRKDQLGKMPLPLRNWSLGGKDVLKDLARRVEGMISGHTQTQDKDSKDLRDIRYKDVAVLCRWNTEVKSIAKAFREAGVPVSCPEDKILDRAEIQLVLSMLNLVRDPQNAYVKASLLHLLGDIPTEKILNSRLANVIEADALPDENEQWAKRSRWAEDNEIIARLRKMTERIQELSVTDIVISVIDENNLFDRVQQWGESLIRQQNLGTIINVARQYDDHCNTMGLGASLGGFINYLETAGIEAPKDMESNTVKVMTYHKSKGLEWSVVILYSLDCDELEEESFFKRSLTGVNELRLTDDGSKYELHYMPTIITGKQKPTEQQISLIRSDYGKALQERQKKEIRRLLYVGMTRSRDYLISIQTSPEMPWAWLGNAGITPSTEQNEKGEMDIWGCKEEKLLVQNVNYVEDEGNEDSEASSAVKTCLLQKTPTPLDYSTIAMRVLSPSTLEHKTPEGFVAPEPVVFEGVTFRPLGEGEGMASIGTTVHDALAVFAPEKSDEENTLAAATVIQNHGMKEVLPDASRIVNTARHLYDWLTNEFGAFSRTERELPFTLALDNGQMLRGEMDLLWFTSDKECVLIDYKCYPGKINDVTNPDNAHYVGIYIPQMTAYRKALSGAGIKVKATVIYYAMLGVAIKVQ